MKNAFPIIVSVAVVAIFSWYYLIVRSQPLNFQWANAIVAFSAVIILGLAMVAGSLAKFVKPLSRYAHWRREFGLIGFALAAMHVALVIPLLIYSEEGSLFSTTVSVAVAAVAFVIFLLMALTSTESWMKSLGYDNWKNLQRTGYIALVLVMFHVLLLDKGAFLTRITGQVAIGFILTILLLRAIAFAANIREHKAVETLPAE